MSQQLATNCKKGLCYPKVEFGGADGKAALPTPLLIIGLRLILVITKTRGTSYLTVCILLYILGVCPLVGTQTESTWLDSVLGKSKIGIFSPDFEVSGYLLFESRLLSKKIRFN